MLKKFLGLGSPQFAAKAAGRTAASDAHQPPLGSFLSDMMVLRDSTSARVSSWDQTGGNLDWRPAEPGVPLEIANIKGAGCIRHIYFTIATPEHYMNDLVLRMYWDGCDTPCVETPFGDFFGMRYDRVRLYQSLLVTVNPGANRLFGTVGFNSYFPMPFANGARITLTNEGPNMIKPVWWHVDYEKLASLPANIGRFHAQWRRENLTTPVGPDPNKCLHDGINIGGAENYVILDAEGQGNLAGLFLHVDNVGGGWYGEGDDMIFIDGRQWPPALHGTGTEEIFGGGACPQDEYIGPYTGWLYSANRDFAGKVSMYRFYVTDPIRFQKSIHMSIEHGHANNYGNDYSSTVFWYQTEPHKPFPQLLPTAARYPLEGNDPHEQAWKQYREVQQEMSAVYQARRQKDVPMPESGAEAAAELVAIERAFNERDNQRVLALCEQSRLKIKKALADLA